MGVHEQHRSPLRRGELSQDVEQLAINSGIDNANVATRERDSPTPPPLLTNRGLTNPIEIADRIGHRGHPIPMLPRITQRIGRGLGSRFDPVASDQRPPQPNPFIASERVEPCNPHDFFCSHAHQPYRAPQNPFGFTPIGLVDDLDEADRPRPLSGNRRMGGSQKRTGASVVSRRTPSIWTLKSGCRTERVDTAEGMARCVNHDSVGAPCRASYDAGPDPEGNAV